MPPLFRSEGDFLCEMDIYLEKGCPFPSSMMGIFVRADSFRARAKQEYLSKEPSTMGCGVPSRSAR